MRLDIAPEWIDDEGGAHHWRVVDLDGETWGYTQDGKRVVAPLSLPFDHASEAFAEKERLLQDQNAK